MYFNGHIKFCRGNCSSQRFFYEFFWSTEKVFSGIKEASQSLIMKKLRLPILYTSHIKIKSPVCFLFKGMSLLRITVCTSFKKIQNRWDRGDIHEMEKLESSS